VKSPPRQLAEVGPDGDARPAAAIKNALFAASHDVGEALMIWPTLMWQAREQNRR
jgi:hypothetical protein